MESPLAIALDPAAPAESSLLGNLLELYIHELSALFPTVTLGADGRFGYPQLPRYWSESDRRFPFLIRHHGRVAGFILAQRAALGLGPDDTYDVAEFFVLRQYRRSAVGMRAAHLLWRRLVGAWTVRVAEDHPSALAFWRAVIAAGPTQAMAEARVRRRGRAWIVFSFTTPASLI